MVSYFDLKPGPSKPPAAAVAAAEAADLPDKEAFTKMSFLSPQVSRILDDMDFEERSDSEEDGASGFSDDSASDKQPATDRKAKQGDDALRKSKTYPQHNKHVHINAPPPRPGLGVGGSRPKGPHMARLHSLRSMLFSTRIEENINKSKEADAEEKWKTEHEHRKGLNRPRTPESPTKEGFTHKIGNRLRRLTSKEVPTMEKIKERPVKEETESTASSSSGEDERRSEEINHSDVEDLVRWVSKRDPPSDGEARKGKLKKGVDQEDSETGSLRHSDVEELVRYASRRQEPLGDVKEEAVKDPYSEVSTESDSDAVESRKESMAEKDVDDLVRWVSRREGSRAGPVKEAAVDVGDSSDDEREFDSGSESDVPLERTIPSNTGHASKPDQATDGAIPKDKPKPKKPGLERGLTHQDVDELVQWVSKKNPDAE